MMEFGLFLGNSFFFFVMGEKQQQWEERQTETLFKNIAETFQVLTYTKKNYILTLSPTLT